jgi:hypothetical protein
MRTLFIALRALFFASGFVLLWGWLALRIRTLDQWLGLTLPARTVISGIIVMLVGGIVGTYVYRDICRPGTRNPGHL